jgi:hypothetical protein
MADEKKISQSTSEEFRYFKDLEPGLQQYAMKLLPAEEIAKLGHMSSIKLCWNSTDGMFDFSGYWIFLLHTGEQNSLDKTGCTRRFEFKNSNLHYF